MQVYITMPNGFTATITTADALKVCFDQQTRKRIPASAAAEIYHYACSVKRNRERKPLKRYPVPHFEFRSVPTPTAIGGKPLLQIFNNQAYRYFEIVEIKKTRIRIEMDFPSGIIGTWIPAINYNGEDYFLSPYIK